VSARPGIDSCVLGMEGRDGSEANEFWPCVTRSSEDVARNINSRMRLPVQAQAGDIRIIDRAASEKVEEGAARVYTPVIKQVGWHLVEVKTSTSRGEPVEAVLEVQVVSSSA
jgi:hypothetical protein